MKLNRTFKQKLSDWPYFRFGKKKKMYEDEAGESSPALGEISNNSREIDRASGFKKINK